LNDLAWRMKDKTQFASILNRISQRYIFHPTLWSYAVQHLDAIRLREYLEEHGSFSSQCGLNFESQLLTVDPEMRRWYEHVEYSPLINSRAHQVGIKQRILNGSLAAQYAQLLQTLVYRKTLTDEDRLAIVYYLLTQERVAEAAAWFAQIKREQIAEQMPYDYAAAWLALVQMDVATARQVAATYADYPLPRWQQRFAAISQVVAETEGAGTKISDPDSALQQQTAATADVATVDVEATPDGISLRYRNATTLRLHYHLMDVELLFSRDPFGNQARGGLTLVKPNHVELIEIPAGETQRVHRLPDHLQRSNVMVEVSAGQQMATATVYANNLDVQVVDSLGQLQVRTRDGQQVLPATYVKV
jgi:predicted transcriptional regulator